MRNGWRARTTLKDHTITPSWPCTSCRLSAGGLHGYTSYEDSWSTHTPAKSRQSAPTSMTLHLFYLFSLCLYFITDAGLMHSNVILNASYSSYCRPHLYPSSLLLSDSQIKHQRNMQSIARLFSSGAWWISSTTCSG